METVLEDVQLLANRETMNATTAELIKELQDSLESFSEVDRWALGEMLGEAGRVNISNLGAANIIARVGNDNIHH
ncbi:hypothetical protein ColTof4_11861 [Colletotrichum tofieldiae]|nr:hypothetical protein ColTof3_03065 [Colletotrichum tofieldiae]GKT79438.1 hypothetical protein ColTof4_11861 [Colletotrichum tofieldiae]GKT82614.1 hypothetical protein Ct61P_00464 [Colletotrichum tofieldiae]